MGAADGAGGWLVAAPGTPVGWAGPGVPVLSTTCWLRTALASCDRLGRCCSEVDSVWLKSTSAVTCALTLLRPTTGSRMSMMRRVYCASIICTYCSCWASKLPLPLPSGASDSSLPESSSTLTAAVASSGTLDATRCTMPASCARSSVRPGYRLTSTEAEGFCCSLKNPFWLGSARCTRALCTDDSAWMERVSSPSSPR